MQRNASQKSLVVLFSYQLAATNKQSSINYYSETQLTNFTYEEGPEGIFSAAFNFNKVRGAPIKLVRIDYAQLNNF